MHKLAEQFVSAGIINVMQEGQPFTLTSGRKSPVYANCRAIMGHVELRTAVIAAMAERIQSLMEADKLHAVLGGESAGINFAALVADRLQLPTGYVRKAARKHGLGQQIEGMDVADKHVVLVEDLMTDGKSKRVFLDSIRAAGGVCRHVVVAFGYGIFPQAVEQLETEYGVTTHSLLSWKDILETPQLGKAQKAQLQRFMDAPE